MLCRQPDLRASPQVPPLCPKGWERLTSRPVEQHSGLLSTSIPCGVTGDRPCTPGRRGAARSGSQRLLSKNESIPWGRSPRHIRFPEWAAIFK